MEHAAVSVFGKSGCVQIEPQMISEDFACYGSEVPICCALLGVGSPVGLHSAAFCPDSSVLLPAARFLAESAWSVLEDARAYACVLFYYSEVRPFSQFLFTNQTRKKNPAGHHRQDFCFAVLIEVIRIRLISRQSFSREAAMLFSR